MVNVPIASSGRAILPIAAPVLTPYRNFQERWRTLPDVLHRWNIQRDPKQKH
jgi:hypothetical protein